MAITVKPINADVSVDRSYVYELAKQYDHLSRKYRVIITDKGKPVTLTGQESILMRMQAEGESIPYVNKWIEWEDGNIVFTFTSNMLSKIGLVHFEFVVYDAPGGTAVLSTRQCNLKIEESLIDYDGLIASEDFNVLSDLISNALQIPALIDDINTSIEEVTAKILEVNTKLALYETQMQTYSTEFAAMQTEQQAVIDALHTYMEDVENIAAAHATESKSWAIGTTGTRVGEDTDNSKFHSLQSKSEADRAKIEADKAATYSAVVAPTFHIDFSTMELVQDTAGTGITFTLDENKVLSFELA